MRHTYHLHPSFLDAPINVIVIGCGGTGCEVVDALARIDLSIRALGHPAGLRVTLADGDTVSASNIGRQRFAPSDIGKNKATVLAARYNLAFGLEWADHPFYMTPKNIGAALPSHYRSLRPVVVITCVDRASVRVAIGKHFTSRAKEAHPQQLSSLWLDFGNGASTGQAILGHLFSWSTQDDELRLPNVHNLYPHMNLIDDDAEPSCSLAEALRHQELGINRMVVDAGMFSLLMPLLTKGHLKAHGVMVDMLAGRTSPLLIDTDAWDFMRGAPKPRKRRASQKDKKPAAPPAESLIAAA